MKKTLLIFIVLIMPAIIMAQKKAGTDSLKTDSIKIAALYNEGKKYTLAFDKKGPEYMQQIIKLCTGKTSAYFTRYHGDAIAALASFYMYTGKYDQAVLYYNKLMQFGIDNKSGFDIAKANLGFGNIADYKSDYETSINKNLLALKYFESAHDTAGTAAATGNVANSYIRIKQYQKAVSLLNNAINLYLKKGLNRQAANNMSSLARAYQGLGNKQKELELKLKAFSLFSAEGYKKGIATVAMNLGVFYAAENNINEAKKYYDISLKNSWQINDNGNIAILYNNMADLNLKINKPETAMLCTDSAWYYSQKSGDRLAQADALLNKAILSHMQSKHNDGETFSNQYIALRDSIYNSKMQSQVADMEVKYETEKKENQIALLNIENNNKSLLLKNSLLQINKKQLQITQQNQALTINQLELKNKNEKLINQQLDAEQKEQNIKSLQKQSHIQKLEITNRGLKIKQKNYTIAVILVLIIAGAALAYSLYNRYRSKQKVMIQQQRLEHQEHLTQAIIDAEEKERKRIASDLHDGVGQMFSAVKMNLNGLLDRVKIDRDEDRFLAEKTMALVDESCKEVRVISHQMMPNMLLRSGIASDVKSFIEKIDSESLRVNVEAIGFKDRLESNVEIVLYRVIQETVNNVIKHAKATTLYIRLNRDSSGINAVIADNGIGFNTDLKDDFEGIGLKNIATRIEYLKGTINYVSAPGMGTSVKIWVPVE